jgi:hypothetical protein
MKLRFCCIHICMDTRRLSGISTRALKWEEFWDRGRAAPVYEAVEHTTRRTDKIQYLNLNTQIYSQSQQLELFGSNSLRVRLIPKLTWAFHS